jgi:hypothetical protein
MKRFDDINKELTDNILKMIECNAAETNVNQKHDIWNDSSMIMTDTEETYTTLIAAFDILGIAFACGEPDGEGEHYYIDFA